MNNLEMSTVLTLIENVNVQVKSTNVYPNDRAGLLVAYTQAATLIDGQLQEQALKGNAVPPTWDAVAEFMRTGFYQTTTSTDDGIHTYRIQLGKGNALATPSDDIDVIALEQGLRAASSDFLRELAGRFNLILSDNDRISALQQLATRQNGIYLTTAQAEDGTQVFQLSIPAKEDPQNEGRVEVRNGAGLRPIIDRIIADQA